MILPRRGGEKEEEEEEEEEDGGGVVVGGRSPRSSLIARHRGGPTGLACGSVYLQEIRNVLNFLGPRTASTVMQRFVSSLYRE